MVRKNTGIRRGPRAWTTASQFDFLMARAPAWVADPNGDRISFYTNMCWLFLKRYGWDSTEEHNPDPAESELEEIRAELTAEMAAGDSASQKIRQGQYEKLNGRIGNWYRHHCQKLIEKHSKATNPLSPLALFEQRHAPPRKKQVRHVYSQLHFKRRIRPSLLKERARMELNGETEPSVRTVNRVTKDCWDYESDDFKKALRKIVNDMYSSAYSTYTSFIEEMASDDFLAEALADPAEYLQPIADLLAKKYGWAVSIFMTGPLAAQDTSGPDPINVISVHSGSVAGGVQNIGWPQFAPEGFMSAQRSFLEFGHAVFNRRYVAPLLPVEIRSAPIISSLDTLAPSMYRFDNTSQMPAPCSSTTPVTQESTNATATAHLQVTPTGSEATATISSPSPPASSVTASLSLAADGSSATATLTGVPGAPSITAPIFAAPVFAAPVFTPSSLPVDITPQRSPDRTQPAPQELPGTGPGQVNGFFTDNAGVDHDCDEWTKLLKFLWPFLQDDLGPEWKLCLARFVNYERHHGFEAKSTCLPKGDRPAEVAHWLKCGRPAVLIKFDRKGDHFTSWPKRWWAWWRQRQPVDRVGPNEVLLQDAVVNDWSQLDYHGDNGLLTFAVALYCWGVEVKLAGLAGGHSEWLIAVSDMSWCLHRLVADVDREESSSSKPTGRKRTRNVPVNGDVPSKNLQPTGPAAKKRKKM